MIASQRRRRERTRIGTSNFIIVLMSVLVNYEIDRRRTATDSFESLEIALLQERSRNQSSRQWSSSVDWEVRQRCNDPQGLLRATAFTWEQLAD